MSVTDETLDNLRLAYERTALAWMRTSLALIGFGFTIDKFFEGLAGRKAAAFVLSPHFIGTVMIVFGLIALVLFGVELREFRKRYPAVPRSMAGFVAAMIAVLGVLALLAALLT
jgi:putative membrane protein